MSVCTCFEQQTRDHKMQTLCMLCSSLNCISSKTLGLLYLGLAQLLETNSQHIPAVVVIAHTCLPKIGYLIQ